VIAPVVGRMARRHVPVLELRDLAPEIDSTRSFINGSREASISPLSVAQKAMLALGLGLLIVVAGVAATAVLTSVPTALLLWSAALCLLLGAAFLTPVRTEGLASSPDPAASYAAAVARFGTDAAASPEPLNPLCHPELLLHGRSTRTAIVLLHGISSCPHAFVELAPMLHARGHNVLVLRMPENGYADRATDALKHLTAEKLARWGDMAADLGAGLGEEVVVLGISAGGTVAAWIAQNRPDVACAVLVAPMFGLARFGGAMDAAIMRLTLFLPDFSIWKDPLLRARFQGLPHCYKRQSSRATGEVLRLACAVRRQADAAPPAVASAVLVINANDRAVDNPVAARLADAWARRGTPVTRFEFPAAHRLGHDIIDPAEPGADPALAYPVLIDLIEGRGVDQSSRAADARTTSRTAAATSRTVVSRKGAPPPEDAPASR
jgi:alpha-beta hydrolase superfamily lysophospholipase